MSDKEFLDRTSHVAALPRRQSIKAWLSVIEARCHEIRSAVDNNQVTVVRDAFKEMLDKVTALQDDLKEQK